MMTVVSHILIVTAAAIPVLIALNVAILFIIWLRDRDREDR